MGSQDQEASMDQKIIDLYDDFTHGGMSRRSFLDKLAALAGSSAAAAAILPILQKHCTQCHAGDDAQGGFVLSDFPDEQSILKHRRQWERLTNLISTGLYPWPSGVIISVAIRSCGRPGTVFTFAR